MSHGASPLAAFHLIGDRSRLEPESAQKRGLRPALYGNFHDLSKLRYHFPLVLLNETTDGRWARPLADIVDEALREIAPPGSEGDEARRQVLALEQAVRTRLAGGEGGSLSRNWEEARKELEKEAENGPRAESLAANLTRAKAALTVDGELVDCTPQLAPRLLLRAWRESERLKAEKLHRRVTRLQRKLEDILEVDDMNSPGARDAARLERSVGTADRTVFDFEEMSRLLRNRGNAPRLPAARRNRIEAAIEVLRSQRFVASPGTRETESAIHRFRYVDCHQALAAFRERLPEVAALVKAVSIGELEVQNSYEEATHDHFFAGFDEHRLGPGDLEQFPSYLVCVEHLDDKGQNVALDVLRAGLPFKILAQTDDVLGDASIAGGQLSFGTQGQQLARMAMGLDNVFVMQAAAASLYRMRLAMMEGLSSDRPALFSVYAGSDYLDAAAATESRIFPTFVYNPAAGQGQAVRFSLQGNPQPESDWPAHHISFEDAGHTVDSEDTTFTLADFVAADARFADRFACIPRAEWSDELVTVDRFLGLSASERADKVPYILLIDADNVLHRAIVDEKLIDAATRCKDAWRSLREYGGMENSHVAVALTEAEAAWEAEKAELLARARAEPATEPEPQTPAAAPADETPEPVAEEPEAEPASDDPWIETIRCTSCNECIQINDRMFGYDADKRAYINDPDAGTYRQLVEAAEGCQVAIIHPGKPRNPKEPGLEELQKRAEPFL